MTFQYVTIHTVRYSIIWTHRLYEKLILVVSKILMLLTSHWFEKQKCQTNVFNKIGFAMEYVLIYFLQMFFISRFTDISTDK